jgi:hypothetical protein
MKVDKAHQDTLRIIDRIDFSEKMDNPQGNPKVLSFLSRNSNNQQKSASDMPEAFLFQNRANPN